ncbi:MAG: hypothetical protein ACR2PT_22970, partial [Endozoicomonas sp.]
SKGITAITMPATPDSPLSIFHRYAEPQHYLAYTQDVLNGNIPSGVEHAIDAGIKNSSGKFTGCQAYIDPSYNLVFSGCKLSD